MKSLIAAYNKHGITGVMDYEDIHHPKYTEYKPILYDQTQWCAGCKEPLPYRQLCIDHIIPVSAGGTDEFYNLQLLCFPCNLLKSNKSQTWFHNRLVELKIVANHGAWKYG